MSKTLLLTLTLSILSISCVHTKRSQESKDRPVRATPIDAISGILAAFDTHSVVALDEGSHNNEQAHAFRLALIRDPRFAAIVNDIVVEFGAAQNQGVIDRFVNGEDVPDQELRKVWQDTTQISPIWEVPIYEEFYRAVRAVNLSLPKDKRLRVLLGDPPIDWDRYKSIDFSRRDSHPAELIQKEVLAKNRRALVIYGGGHFLRRQPTMVLVKDESKVWPKMLDITMMELLEQSGVKVYSIMTYSHGKDIALLDPAASSWPAPSLIRLKGTNLGAEPFSFFLDSPVKTIKEGIEYDLKVLPDFTMGEQFDALLYVGPTASITYSNLPAKLCLDPAWVKMRKTRAKLNGAAWMANVIDEICAEVLKKSTTP